MPLIKEWLQGIYAVVYLDAIHFKVKQDGAIINKAATEEGALLELDRFEEVGGAKYLLIIRSWQTNWDELATFFKYPPEIRKLIYTSNMIESYHC